MNSIAKIKIRVQVKALPQYILVSTVIFIMAWLTDKYVEAISFCMAFCAIRFKFDRVFHCDTISKCLILTNGIAVTSVPLLFSINMSLVAMTSLSLLVNVLVCAIAKNIWFQNKIDKINFQLPPFNLSTCSIDEFVFRCKEKNIKQEKIPYAIDLLKSSLSVQELTERYFVSPNTIYQDRWRFRNRLK